MYRNIGLTGAIGSGKNTAAEIFQDLGFYVIDSDVSSRKVMQQGEKAYKEIVDFFGKDILLDNKDINRKALGEIVFKDKSKLHKLESIVHPAVTLYEKKLKSDIFARDNKAIVIVHAALLIETCDKSDFDMMIVIHADKNTRLNRVIKRDNRSAKEIEDIINSQLDDEERLKYADVIIDNSSDIDNLKNEVKRVANLIHQINYGEKHYEKQ